MDYSCKKLSASLRPLRETIECSLRLCDLCDLCEPFLSNPLNQSLPQVKADSNLSAHHVTTVTYAGGLAFICSACGINPFAQISVIRGRKMEYLCVSALSASHHSVLRSMKPCAIFSKCLFFSLAAIFRACSSKLRLTSGLYSYSECTTRFM